MDQSQFSLGICCITAFKITGFLHLARWYYISSSTSFPFSDSQKVILPVFLTETESGQHHRLRLARNICPSLQRPSNPPTVSSAVALVSPALLQCLLWVFSQYLLTKKCIFICHHNVFSHFYQHRKEVFPQCHESFYLSQLRNLRRGF